MPPPPLWRVALARASQLVTVPLLALLLVILPLTQYADAAVCRRPLRDPWWPLAKLLQAGALCIHTAARWIGEEIPPPATNLPDKDLGHETRAAVVRHR
ncbi:MAG: hypothetical protein IT204_13195 [Fimbriimonadaceae bacterium]|nr:hypothetical protein [Fimbriimonadaceae bacterium]